MEAPLEETRPKKINKSKRPLWSINGGDLDFQGHHVPIEYRYHSMPLLPGFQGYHIPSRF